jgi:hypothetical protein
MAYSSFSRGSARARRALAAAVMLASACSDDAAAPSDGGPRSDSDRDAALPSEHDVLFVGNSYIFVNDVSGHYRAIVSALGPTVRLEEVTEGGYTLAEHARDATTDGTDLSRWLRTGALEERSFDAVILQEQSQTGGFSEGNADRVASVEAASTLAWLARTHGSTVVLYLTWGRARGDELNPELFPSFLAMQDALDIGSMGLAEELRAEGSDVRIAPVGGGFRIVYEDVLAAGGDPLAEGSDFDALYEPDDSHPSLRGAYLAACILAGTTTGADARGFLDEPALGPEISAALRDVCARALADSRWRIADVLVGGAGYTPPGAMEFGEFGSHVATSADGATVLVGSQRFSGKSQEPAVFARGGASWIQRGELPGGPAMALADSGTRALVGHRTYVESATGEWTEEAEVPSPATPERGYSVALSRDGNRVVVGAQSENAGVGAARVYVRSGAAWTEEAVLTASDGAPNDFFGGRVAIDGDGSRVLVGAPRWGWDEPRAGYARVFRRTGSVWAEEARLDPEPAVKDMFGAAVALSADGTRAIVGAPQANRVFSFVRSGTTWSAPQRLEPGRLLPGVIDSAVGLFGPQFGHSIAVSADGGRLLVGAPGEDRPGAIAAGSVFVFELEGERYRQALLLLPDRGEWRAEFGASVALTADGATAIVGAPGDSYLVAESYGTFETGFGAIYSFELPAELVGSPSIAVEPPIAPATYVPSCRAMDARIDDCTVRCLGASSAFWDGSRCVAARCDCAGTECGVYASVAACEAAHASCDALLCQSTGGEWFAFAGACGHFACGVPPPRTCEELGPACDCGPLAVFTDGVGCSPSASCTPPAPRASDVLCTETGGEVIEACADTWCGRGGGGGCMWPSRCRCGDLEIFDASRGCVPSATCELRQPGERCDATGRCGSGTVCCERDGVRTCVAPECSADGVC